MVFFTTKARRHKEFIVSSWYLCALVVIFLHEVKNAD